MKKRQTGQTLLHSTEAVVSPHALGRRLDICSPEKIKAEGTPGRARAEEAAGNRGLASSHFLNAAFLPARLECARQAHALQEGSGESLLRSI